MRGTQERETIDFRRVHVPLKEINALLKLTAKALSLMGDIIRLVTD